MSNDFILFSQLFTDNLMDIYISILSQTKTSEVETVILVTFDKLLSHSTANPDLLLPILKWILTGSGNIAFDKASGSTVVQRCVLWTIFQNCLTIHALGGQRRTVKPI